MVQLESEFFQAGVPKGIRQKYKPPFSPLSDNAGRLFIRRSKRRALVGEPALNAGYRPKADVQPANSPALRMMLAQRSVQYVVRRFVGVSLVWSHADINPNRIGDSFGLGLVDSATG